MGLLFLPFRKSCPLLAPMSKRLRKTFSTNVNLNVYITDFRSPNRLKTIQCSSWSPNQFENDFLFVLLAIKKCLYSFSFLNIYFWKYIFENNIDFFCTILFFSRAYITNECFYFRIIFNFDQSSLLLQEEKKINV